MREVLLNILIDTSLDFVDLDFKGQTNLAFPHIS